MTSCATLPILTNTDTTTVIKTSTSNSLSTTTLPDATSTIVSESCLATAAPTDIITGCLSSALVTSFATIPGDVQTVQIPFIVTTTSFQTFLSTVFTTSCTTSVSVTFSPTTQKTTEQPPPPQGTGSFTTSSALVATTSETTIISQETTTLPNGDVSLISKTSTSTFPPTTVSVPTVVPVVQSDDRPAAKAAAPIIGGVLAGFFGLIAFVGLIWWWFMRRRRRWNAVLDTDESGKRTHRYGSAKKPRFDLDDDTASVLEPKPTPYQYGLVGLPSSSPATETDSTKLQVDKEPSRQTLSPSPFTPKTSRPSTADSTQPLRGQEMGVNETEYKHTANLSLSGPLMTHAASFSNLEAVGWTLNRDSVGSVDSFPETPQHRPLKITNRGDTDSVYSTNSKRNSKSGFADFTSKYLETGTPLDSVQESASSDPRPPFNL